MENSSRPRPRLNPPPPAGRVPPCVASAIASAAAAQANVTFRSRITSPSHFTSAAIRVGSALGLSETGSDVLHEIGADRLFLDGLVSVWHP